MLKNNKKVILLILIAILGFLGFLDSTFLTIKHYQGTLPPCSLALGCERVLTSSFATIGSLPTAMLGSGFYLAVMGLSILISQNPKFLKRNSKQEKDTIAARLRGITSFQLLFFLVLSGFIVSVILFLIQAFVLNSYCQYCLISEAISTLILLLSIILLKMK